MLNFPCLQKKLGLENVDELHQWECDKDEFGLYGKPLYSYCPRCGGTSGACFCEQFNRVPHLEREVKKYDKA